MTEEELKAVVKENKEVLHSLDQRLHRIERKFIWNTIFGFLKFIILAAPIIAGIIYLTPILKDYIKIFDPIFKTLQDRKGEIIDPLTASEQMENNEIILQSFCDPDTRQAMIDQLCK